MTKSVFTDKYERLRRVLIEARQAAGFTQVELAERLKRPQSYVSKYERGERRLDVVEFIEVANTLGFSASEFVDKIDDKRGTRGKGRRR